MRARNSLFLFLLLTGCLPQPTPAPNPTPTPSNTYGFEYSIPPTMPNKADAVQLAAVFDEFANRVEADTTVIQTTKDLELRLAAMGNYFYRDHRLSTDSFIATIKAVQEREIPQADGDAQPVTPELRRKAVEIYRAIAYGLRQ